MSNVKVNCSFCGGSNTKIITEKAGNIFNRSYVERETIDYSKKFYRCVGCGRIYCRSCITRLKGVKIGVFSHSLQCPKCNSKAVRI